MNIVSEEAPTAIRTVIVEDKLKTLKLLKSLLENEPGINLVAEYTCAEDLLEGVEDDQPDVILMDIELPGMSGIEATKFVKQHHLSTDVVMLTGSSSDANILDSFRAGATGYILKGDSDIGQKVRESRHGSVMSPSIARQVIEHLKPLKLFLTPREVDVLNKIAGGFSEKRMEDELHISKHTIHQHIKNIYKKLEVHTQAEAVAKAVRAGIIKI